MPQKPTPADRPASPARGAAAARDERLKAALKANIARRKAQARGLDAIGLDAAGSGGDGQGDG